MKVKDIPLDDRPREKLILRGSKTLTDAELLAILLRTGIKGSSVIEVAQKLTNKYGNLSQLAFQSVESLQKNLGIGKDKAATLVAAFEISRRVESQSKWFSDKSITSPSEVAKIFIPLLRDEVKEKFIVVSLNSANRIIRYNTISTGSLNESIVHPREVFKVAIENNSANIILLHNHPSGNCEASNSDIKTTQNLVEAGKLLDIEVFDHIIVADNNYFSFVEKQII
ncbi:MAG: DNA repair protein RadC [Melioribacteraceae bacterium]|jgi:DNA repair protein RadC|nr:DNA repair protein RadC [Melioribacteraceae bacterium]